MTLGPLIVQSDHTVLLEVAHPDAEDARHALAVFAELERAPEHIHTYRVTRLGLWNARAAGHTAEEIVATLDRYAKFPVPSQVSSEIGETMRRYGRLTIERVGGGQPFRYDAQPPEVFLENMRAAGAEMAYMSCVYDNFKRMAANSIPGAQDTFDNFTAITGRQPVRWEAFVQKHRSAFAY